jgi:hypothetical protein
MIASGLHFHDFCRALEDAHGDLLATSDRECLLALHRAPTGLKGAGETAILQIPSDEYLPN